MADVRLDRYENAWYRPGGVLKRTVWYFTNLMFFKTMLPFPSSFKVFLLRLFGAGVGRGVVIKPDVNIKYPWFLKIGDHVWIGENVWIDSLGKIEIGDHVVVSQGAYLLTGSHDYKAAAFDLIVRDIRLEDGVWIGARSVVCPGVTCHSHSILTVGSVATADLDAYGIYQGNPAVRKRTRKIS